MRGRRFDETDLRILTELQRDGRITFQHLARIVGLSPRPCLERVRRLEREGIITGYSALVNLTKLLATTVTVIVRITVKQGREPRIRFEQQLKNCPAVVECFQVSGMFDYVVKVVCSDIDSYRQLSESWLDDASMQVERLESNVVLRATKDDGIYPVAIAELQALVPR